MMWNGWNVQWQTNVKDEQRCTNQKKKLLWLVRQHWRRQFNDWLRDWKETSLSKMLLKTMILTPCFLDGNSTNTIPHSKRKLSRNFPNGKCDSQPGAGNRSFVYEVNMPLWRFGPGKSRRFSEEDADKERSARIEEGRRQAAATTGLGRPEQ